MKKLTVWLLMLLALLLILSAASGEGTGEAENLTGECVVNVVDQRGKTKCITDGKYTTFWESSKRNEPWVTITSEKPIYGLYLCFQKLPESYVIQKASGEDWVTVAQGGSPRFHHVFFELEGLTRIRILSTMEKKNEMGFNEIYAFGKGEIPGWVQRWEEPSDQTDILFVATHPDDDVLFMGSAITWYAAEMKKNVQVAYLTMSNTTRRSEALNGLWTMGVRRYPEFGPFSDKYSKPPRIEQEYRDMGGQNKVLGWVTELYRRFKPAVVVTQDINGEYGHPQHEMLVDAVIKCWDRAADPAAFPEDGYAPWEVKKLYVHLYGSEEESTDFNWDMPLESMGGKTANETAEEAFSHHKTQEGKGNKFNGKRVPFSVAEYGVKRYPNNRFGLYASRVGADETHKDFLEHIETAAGLPEPAAEPQEPEEAMTAKPAAEPEEPAAEPAAAPEESAADTRETETAETPEEPAAEEADAGETVEEEPETPPEEKPVIAQKVEAPVPEWADVTVNSWGYLDEGEYVFADPDNGHYMYVSPTLRVQIERTYEEPDKRHPFYCFTADIWCDLTAGEAPVTVYKDPEKPKSQKDFVRNIARENKLVFATTTDYYIYRIKADYPTGIEVRNGVEIFDDPHKLVTSMPTYETLALYEDGHAESWSNPEKSAGEYIAEGATQVYTFGPCLVRDGELTDYVLTKANSSYNPRLAIGVAEDGHYIVMMCEGRVKRSKGVQMAELARMMQARGCRLAVNMDGGQSAVIAFMGKQLNEIVKSDPYGREQADVLAFGVSDQVGVFDYKAVYEK